jgi:hypothetical protein
MGTGRRWELGSLAPWGEEFKVVEWLISCGLCVSWARGAGWSLEEIGAAMATWGGHPVKGRGREEVPGVLGGCLSLFA